MIRPPFTYAVYRGREFPLSGDVPPGWDPRHRSTHVYVPRDTVAADELPDATETFVRGEDLVARLPPGAVSRTRPVRVTALLEGRRVAVVAAERGRWAVARPDGTGALVAQAALSDVREARPADAFGPRPTGAVAPPAPGPHVVVGAGRHRVAGTFDDAVGIEVPTSRAGAYVDSLEQVPNGDTTWVRLPVTAVDEEVEVAVTATWRGVPVTVEDVDGAATWVRTDDPRAGELGLTGTYYDGHGWSGLVSSWDVVDARAHDV